MRMIRRRQDSRRSDLAAALERWGDVVLARPDAARGRPRALAGDGLDRTPTPGSRAASAAGGALAARDGPSPTAGQSTMPACSSWSAAPLRPHRPVSRAGRPLGLDGQRFDAFSGSAREPRGARGPEVLNLFAYTGGASVALAAAGARVTHVDASRPAIGWARENAAAERRRPRSAGSTRTPGASSTASAAADAATTALLLDPPAFGRGPAGDWQLDRDLGRPARVRGRPPPRRDPAFVLLNVYTGDLDAGDAGSAAGVGPGRPARRRRPRRRSRPTTLALTSADGRRLPTGIYARGPPSARVQRRATWTRRAGPG